MSQLSGHEKQELQGALLDAFPTLDKFAQLLSFRLEANLQAIAGAANLSDAIAKVIDWTEATGRTRDLVTAARDVNPGNERLAAVAARLLSKPGKVDGPGDARTWRRLFAPRTLVAAAWSAVLLAAALSLVVRVPGEVDLTVTARVVSLRLGGDPGQSRTLFTRRRLASMTMQNLKSVAVKAPGTAEITAPSGGAAVTADDISEITLDVEAQTLVQFDTTAEEPDSLKLVLQKGTSSALVRASHVRAIRCPGCDEGAMSRVRAEANGGTLLRLQGDPVRTVLLLSSDGDPVKLSDLLLDVTDTVAFDRWVDERPVPTILQGTLAYRNAATEQVPLTPSMRLMLSGLTGGNLTLEAGPTLEVRLVGRAGSITIIEGDMARDLRPTAFAALRHRPGVVAIPLAVMVVLSWPWLKRAMPRTEALP